jgi:Bacterial SH3 domain
MGGSTLCMKLGTKSSTRLSGTGPQSPAKGCPAAGASLCDLKLLNPQAWLVLGGNNVWKNAKTRGLQWFSAGRNSPGTSLALSLGMNCSRSSLISLVSALALFVGAACMTGCAVEETSEPTDGAEGGERAESDTNEVETDELTGSYAVGTSLKAIDAVNMRSAPDLKADILQVIPSGAIVKSASANPRGGFYGVTYNGKTGWAFGAYLAKPDANTEPTSGNDASYILSEFNAGRIGLFDTTFGRKDGADALSNIRDAAAGRRARRSVHGTAPGGSIQLGSKMLSAMVSLRKTYGFTYFVTAIAGASHSAGSFHYSGRAIDIDTINGKKINGDSANARKFMQACRDLGGIEVLGPSNRSDHQDHIHCAF